MQPRSRHSPVIVGDHYELAESLALHYSAEYQEDLVAKAGFSAALLPMSGYTKPQAFDVNEDDVRRPSQTHSSLIIECNARRPLQDPMSLQDALPSAVDPQLVQPSTAYDRQTDHLNYAASAVHQPRATFEAAQSTYPGPELRKAFQVSTYNPERGNEGARVYVYLESTSDRILSTALIANLMFGSCPVPAAWNFLDAGEQHACYKYSIYATAPAFSETRSSSLRIPLRLQIQDESKPDASSIYIGDWLYEDDKQLGHLSSTQNTSRKRKVSDEPSDSPQSTRRIMPSGQQSIKSQNYGSYAYPSASLAYPQSLDFSTMQRSSTPYGKSQFHQTLRNWEDTLGQQNVSGGASTGLMRRSKRQTPTWKSSSGVGYGPSHYPQLNTPPSFQASSASTPSPANPKLKRSSTIQQPSPRTTSTGSSRDGNFNPHTLYSSRVVLELRGDLNTMQANWTPEERALERRVVRFWREQNGATVIVYFKPLRADERSLPDEKHERHISCIYWEEKDKHYLTSVDMIRLLEILLFDDVPFGIDEKGRIRRNLATCEPETVSKANPASESFWSLMMGFPEPRAWSIKKAVKVFEWCKLEEALRKIFSKYSVDPSSIASSFEPQPKPDFNQAQSAAAAGRAPAAYAPTPESITLSPPGVPHGLPSYSHPSPLQQASAASVAHSYTIPALGSHYIPNQTLNSPYTPQASISSLSSAYAVSSIGRARISQAPREDLLASTNDYCTSRPHINAYYPSQSAPQGLSEATAPLGLSGRALEDLSASLNPEIASLGDGQYKRQSNVDYGSDTTQYQEE